MQLDFENHKKTTIFGLRKSVAPRHQMTVQSLYGPIALSKHELNSRYVVEYSDPEPV